MMDGQVNKSIFDMKFNNILRENIKKTLGKQLIFEQKVNLVLIRVWKIITQKKRSDITKEIWWNFSSGNILKRRK